MKEFLIRLIKRESSGLASAIKKSYDDFIYKDKIRYTQSKKYWSLVKKGEPQDQDFGLKSELDKLDLWVAKRGARSSGDPHIAYSSNQYDNKREENPLKWSTSEGTSPIGYEIPILPEEYFEKELADIISRVHDNPLATIICRYIKEKEKALESTDFNKFYVSCVENSIISFDRYFDVLDEYHKKLGWNVLPKNSISIASFDCFK